MNFFEMPKKPELSAEDQALRAAFGRRVQEARKALGLRPEEFGAMGGVSMPHQYRIEAGERTADALYVLRLVQRLGPGVVGMFFGGASTSTVAPEAPGLHMNQIGDGTQIGQVGGSVRINATAGERKRKK